MSQQRLLLVLSGQCREQIVDRDKEVALFGVLVGIGDFTALHRFRIVNRNVIERADDRLRSGAPIRSFALLRLGDCHEVVATEDRNENHSHN